MKATSLLLTLCVCSSFVFAQNPLLLQQANNGNSSVKVEKIIATPEGNAFYNVTEYTNPFSNNWGLWTSDGTREGTKKLVLQDGRYITTEATLLTQLGNNRVLFAGDNHDGYGEVWASDGTQKGTFGLQNFLLGSGTGTPVQSIGAIGSLGVYAAVSNDGVLRLHSTHGTAYADTAVFFTFPSAIASVLYFKTISGILYFEANNSVTHDNEIWRTDGTTAGTYLLKDLTNNGLTSDFMELNGNIYFVTISSTLGDYIWKSDGTANGTVQLKQLATSFQSDNISPSYAATSKALYFAAADGVHGKEVWTTDGTAGGTHIVTDLFAGSVGSNPSSFAVLHDTLFLSANNGLTGQELYMCVGSNIALVKDIYPGGTGSNPSSLAVNNNSIVFSAKPNETEGAELWVSGGSANTTFEMANIAKGASASSTPSLITSGAKNFFAGTYDVNGDGVTNEQCVFVYTPPGKIWTGNVSSDGSVADNWFPSGAPSSTDDVIIPASSTPSSLISPFLFPHSFYNNGGIVNVNNGLVLMTGNFYNEGTINVANGGIFGIVRSASSDGAAHLVGSPGTFNGQITFSSGVNVKLTADVKVNALRVEGADNIYLGNYNLTTDVFSLYTPSIITDGYGKLFLPVGNSPVLFPVLADSLSYNPVTLSNAGTFDYFGVNVKNGLLTQGYSGDTLTSQAVNKTWDISEQTPGGSNVNATFQWNTRDELPPFNRNTIYAAHYTNGAWDKGVLQSASGTAPYTISRSGVTSFSPFAIFSSSSVLPVTFAGIEAKLSGKNVVVSWQAAGSNNLLSYNVQRSTDGITFTNIGKKPGFTSNSLHSYDFTDVNAADLSSTTLYYRVQTVTAEGTSDISQAAWVKLLSSASVLRLWPSPVDNVLHLQLNNGSAQGKVVVYNVAGKPIMNAFVGNSGQTDLAVSQLSAGEYFITIFTNKGNVSSRFIKK